MSINFEQITKRFRGTPVVNDVSLQIESGEFFVLLGPSGSGKSTLLRAAAGLTDIDHGRISFQGRNMTHVPAKSRGVGLVFQNYALFRHMTVGENVEFALRVRGVRRSERQRRRQELLALVDLDGFAGRMPGELSGGQQQRIAVARALAHEPAVLLMDEPFGALDAKIRVELRDTIRQVQRRLGMTTILVTHDQEEAFALADRIGVMHNGRLLEVGRAERLYRFPATRFVATFLGAANLILGQLGEEGLTLGAARISTADSLRPAEGSQEVVTVIRPEDIEVAESERVLRSAPFAGGTVRAVSFAGGLERLQVQLLPQSGLESAVHPDSKGAEGLPLTVEVVRPISEQSILPVVIGRQVALGIRRFHVLPTPISSYRIVCAESATAAIMAQPLLHQLLASMRARVLVPGESQPGESPDSPVQSGVTVLSASPDLPNELHAALVRGARRLLCLPKSEELPRQVLIYCDGDASRRATLGLVASILRHLPAEATFVSIQSASAERAEVANTFRRVLDARAELLEFHGLDIRTDVQIAELHEWVARLASAQEGALVVLGLSGSVSAIDARLRSTFAPLFSGNSRHAVLLSCFCGALTAKGVGETLAGADRQPALSANA
jgi:sulfate/thiosulfate transport system ATP-binding protein